MNKMEPSTLIDITNSRWDGSSKSFTELCSDCKFYRVINNQDRCYWGIAYKVLDKRKMLTFCQLINKPSPREEKLKTFNELEKNARDLENFMESPGGFQ